MSRKRGGERIILNAYVDELERAVICTGTVV
jgi:hypothetical protein